MESKIKTSIIEIVGYFLVALSITCFVGGIWFAMSGKNAAAFSLIIGVVSAIAGRMLLKWEVSLEEKRTIPVKRYDHKVLFGFACVYIIGTLGSCANRTAPGSAAIMIVQASIAIVFALSSTARRDRYRAEEVERINKGNN